MEKKLYQSPLLEVLELVVERGFASSDVPEGGAGSTSWSEWNS